MSEFPFAQCTSYPDSGMRAGSCHYPARSNLSRSHCERRAETLRPLPATASPPRQLATLATAAACPQADHVLRRSLACRLRVLRIPDPRTCARAVASTVTGVDHEASHGFLGMDSPAEQAGWDGEQHQEKDMRGASGVVGVSFSRLLNKATHATGGDWTVCRCGKWSPRRPKATPR